MELKKAIKIEYSKNGDTSEFFHTIKSGKKWVEELGINQMLYMNQKESHKQINNFLEGKSGILNVTSTSGKYNLYAFYTKVPNSTPLREN